MTKGVNHDLTCLTKSSILAGPVSSSGGPCAPFWKIKRERWQSQAMAEIASWKFHWQLPKRWPTIFSFCSDRLPQPIQEYHTLPHCFRAKTFPQSFHKIPQLREITAFWIINSKHKRFSSIKRKAAHFVAVDPSFIFANWFQRRYPILTSSWP